MDQTLPICLLFYVGAMNNHLKICWHPIHRLDSYFIRNCSASSILSLLLPQRHSIHHANSFQVSISFNRIYRVPRLRLSRPRLDVDRTESSPSLLSSRFKNIIKIQFLNNQKLQIVCVYPIGDFDNVNEFCVLSFCSKIELLQHIISPYIPSFLPHPKRCAACNLVVHQSNPYIFRTRAGAKRVPPSGVHVVCVVVWRKRVLYIFPIKVIHM